jgi:hypothetical protein
MPHVFIIKLASSRHQSCKDMAFLPIQGEDLASASLAWLTCITRFCNICLHFSGNAATNKQSKAELNALLGVTNAVALGTRGQNSPWDLLMLELYSVMPQPSDNQIDFPS